MTDHLNWDDQRSHPPATPGDALANNGASYHINNSQYSAPAKNPGAGDGVAIATPGDARADGANKHDSTRTDEPWPAPGDAVLTTDEARLRLYDHHDIFLKERYIQKLVSDIGKLDGRRVPKDGGGIELHISQSSIDRYATENPHKKNAKDIPLDPTDKLFEQLRQIANNKPYGVVYASVAHTRPETPTETPAPAPASKPEPVAPAPEQKPEIQPSAQGDASARQGVSQPDMVPREMYELVKSVADDAKRLFQDERDKREAERAAAQSERIELINDLGQAYNKIADTNHALMELAQKQPGQIYAAINDLLQGMGNPNQPKLIPTDDNATPPIRYSEHHDR